MRVTCASSRASGRAEKVTRAACPTAIREMSTSLTCTLTVIWERSAIWMSAPPEVPPSPPVTAPAPSAAPWTAFITTTEPLDGAVTVRLAAWETDWS